MCATAGRTSRRGRWARSCRPRQCLCLCHYVNHSSSEAVFGCMGPYCSPWKVSDAVAPCSRAPVMEPPEAEGVLSTIQSPENCTAGLPSSMTDELDILSEVGLEQELGETEGGVSPTRNGCDWREYLYATVKLWTRSPSRSESVRVRSVAANVLVPGSFCRISARPC